MSLTYGQRLRHARKLRNLSQDALDIADQLASGRAVGMIFGVIRQDGRIEIGFSGALYDSPLLATGLSSELKALTDAWRRHPGIYIPEEE